MVINTQELRNELLELLRHIAPEANYDLLGPTDDLQEELEIDSFDFLNFLIAINEVYGVEIPESDYYLVRTLENVEEYLIEHQKK